MIPKHQLGFFISEKKNHKSLIQPLMTLPEDKLCSSTSIKKKKKKKNLFIKLVVTLGYNLIQCLFIEGEFLQKHY